MQIYSINNTSQYRRPIFRSWIRETYYPGKGSLNRNNTCFFRERLIKELAEMMSYEFKNLTKVNIYCYGCSDGSEPLSLVMSLLSLEDESNPQKFFPIIARDIDPVAINKAIKNKHKITKIEKVLINAHTHDQYNRFVDEPFGEPIDNGEGTNIIIRKEVYNNVDFAVGDIFNDYKKINPENSVILARNFWPYINHSERNRLLKNLYEHLDTGSYLVIGDFDQKGVAYKLEGDLHSDLIKLGFKPTLIKYVYVK